VTGLVLVPDHDGGIGAGCLREIADVLGRDLPVWALAGSRLVPWGEIGFGPVAGPSRFCVGIVTLANSTTERSEIK
jgi:hypothetical protein